MLESSSVEGKRRGGQREASPIGFRDSIVEILLRTFVKNCVVKGEPAGGAGR